MADILTPAVVSLTSFIWTQLEKYAPVVAKKISDKLKLEKAVHEYMARYQDAYGTIKPIGLTNPIHLEKIYTEVQFTTENLRQHFSGKGLEQSALRDLRHLLSNEKIKTLDGIEAANQFQRLLVVGHPGGGKSTYLRRVGWECLRTHGITKTGHSGTPCYSHELLPILLELKRCRSGESHTLIELLAKELGDCGFPENEALVDSLLESGRILVLLDALDEVAHERVESVVEQALSMTRRYPGCRFIISCRVAFQHDYFKDFQDVTLLDFTNEQIDHFIGNWFSSSEQKADKIAEGFITQLHAHEHKATLELARSPVLLGYLCVAYQGTLALSTNRAEIYRRALDIYLQEWNARELKTEHARLAHPTLPHETELAMLGQIAYEAFTKERFFLTKDEWLSAIRKFMGQLVEKPESLSTEDILRKIAVSQGLIVQRTHQDWSFSHLTLQEYLAAFHIDQADILEEVVRKHLGDDRWREVFLILAGLRPGRLLKIMSKTASQKMHLASPDWSVWCRRLRNWRYSPHDYDQALQVQILGLSIYLSVNHARARSLALGRAHAVALSSTRTFAHTSAVLRDPKLDLDLKLDLDRTHALVLAIDLVRDFNTDHAFVLAIDLVRDFTIDRAPDFARHRTRDFVRHRDRNRDFDRDRDYDVPRNLTAVLVKFWDQSALKTENKWTEIIDLQNALDLYNQNESVGRQALESLALPELDALAVTKYLKALGLIIQCKKAAARVPFKKDWEQAVEQFFEAKPN